MIGRFIYPVHGFRLGRFVDQYFPGAAMRMQWIQPEKNSFRFYEIDLEPTLWGDMALVIRWGRIGKPGRIRIKRSGSEPELQIVADRLARRKQRKGYTEVTPENDARMPGSEFFCKIDW